MKRCAGRCWQGCRGRRRRRRGRRRTRCVAAVAPLAPGRVAGRRLAVGVDWARPRESRTSARTSSVAGVAERHEASAFARPSLGGALRGRGADFSSASGAGFARLAGGLTRSSSVSHLYIIFKTQRERRRRGLSIQAISRPRPAAAKLSIGSRRSSYPSMSTHASHSALDSAGAALVAQGVGRRAVTLRDRYDVTLSSPAAGRVARAPGTTGSVRQEKLWRQPSRGARPRRRRRPSAAPRGHTGSPRARRRPPPRPDRRLRRRVPDGVRPVRGRPVKQWMRAVHPLVGHGGERRRYRPAGRRRGLGLRADRGVHEEPGLLSSYRSCISFRQLYCAASGRRAPRPWTRTARRRPPRSRRSVARRNATSRTRRGSEMGGATATAATTPRRVIGTAATAARPRAKVSVTRRTTAGIRKRKVAVSGRKVAYRYQTPTRRPSTTLCTPSSPVLIPRSRRAP